jgi:transcriptional regulator with XRE-family HTH domain
VNIQFHKKRLAIELCCGVLMPKRQVKRREEIVRLFAQRLRELRLSRGMTQAELARQANVSVTYISQLESADTAPGIDLVDRLAKALGASVPDLLPVTVPPDTLTVLRSQAKRLFEEVLKTPDPEVYAILNPFLAHLAESTTKRR